MHSPIDTLYGIPLYSGSFELHDSIVNSVGSFDKTIKGILNLYKLRQNVEIRIVVNRWNYKDLLNIAHYIYWNIPFVFRVVFMGMEMHGLAEINLNNIWIEPKEYMKYLEEAVLFLNNRMINVMIYNLPHCILTEDLRYFAKDSISSWKKSFTDSCVDCKYMDVCSGVFATSSKIPEGIHSL